MNVRAGDPNRVGVHPFDDTTPVEFPSLLKMVWFESSRRSDDQLSSTTARDRYFFSSGLIRSSSSSNDIDPWSRTPLRKKVGVEVTFNSLRAYC